MIKFFIRLTILTVAIMLTAGLAAGIGVNSFLLAVIFLCTWIIVIPFEDIFWWLFTYSIIFAVLNYDNFGVYIIILMGIAYVFDIIFEYLKRSANDGIVVLYGTMFLLAGVSNSIIGLIQYGIISFDLVSIIIDVLVTFTLFLVISFVIKRVEKFINLYTYGTDMRCHT